MLIYQFVIVFLRDKTYTTNINTYKEDFMPDSLITKQAIAIAMKQLMSVKSFDKITIADITTTCGLNRQSFYYHFQDKYELLNWIFYNDVITILTKELSLDTWSDNLYQMLNVMYENKSFYRNAIKHSFQKEFEQYLLEISTSLFTTTIEHLDQKHVIQEEEKRYLSRFLSFGVIGSITSWVNDGMLQSPLTLKTQIVSVVTHCKAYAAQRYSIEQD